MVCAWKTRLRQLDSDYEKSIPQRSGDSALTSAWWAFCEVLWIHDGAPHSLLCVPCVSFVPQLLVFGPPAPILRALTLWSHSERSGRFHAFCLPYLGYLFMSGGLYPRLATEQQDLGMMGHASDS